eukprot:SAG31_NODE_2852_length_4995_cov_42.074551_3_plen_187_part_00
MIGSSATPYFITDVKYVAHIVDLQRDFYDMLRNLQAQSGGSLMIGSSTFRHYTHVYTATAPTTEEINVSARVRSLENLLWVSNRTANLSSNQFFSLSSGTSCGAADGSYAVFIGAERYPSNEVKWNNATDKGEAYQELRKCFGALGSINHGGLLNAATYLSDESGQLATLDNFIPRYSSMAISFRS